MISSENLHRLSPPERALMALGGPLLLAALAAFEDWALAQAGGETLPGGRVSVSPTSPSAPPRALAGRGRAGVGR